MIIVIPFMVFNILNILFLVVMPVLRSPVTQKLDLFPSLLSVMIIMLVPTTLAIHGMDAYTNLSAVMIIMNVPMTPVILKLDVITAI
jgi:hypothetical protein